MADSTTYRIYLDVKILSNTPALEHSLSESQDLDVFSKLPRYSPFERKDNTILTTAFLLKHQSKRIL